MFLRHKRIGTSSGDGTMRCKLFQRLPILTFAVALASVGLNGAPRKTWLTPRPKFCRAI